MSANVTIFSTATCPRCKLVSAKLHEWGIPHEEKSLIDISAEDRTDCIIEMGYVPIEAPLVRIGYHWLASHEIFEGSTLNEATLRAIL